MSLVRTWFMAMAMFAFCYPGLTGATTYTVGDSMGWAISTDISYYPTWTANNNFVVGDRFQMDGNNGLANITKADYGGCTKVNSVIGSSSLVQIELKMSCPHYYICMVGPQCSLGQKLAINITASTMNSTSPAATTPSAASSTSFGFFSCSALLMVLFG